MDVKGWSIGADSNKCIKRMEMTDIATGSKRYLCMESDLCDCIEANCPIKFTRPDPAEAERAINHLIDCVIRYGDLPVSHKIDKARSDLLKLVGGGNE